MLIGATTENPFFEVNPPLRSRSTLFRLEPLDADDLRVARSTAGSRRSARPPTPRPSTCSSTAAAATAARC